MSAHKYRLLLRYGVPEMALLIRRETKRNENVSLRAVSICRAGRDNDSFANLLIVDKTVSCHTWCTAAPLRSCIPRVAITKSHDLRVGT